jgi:hypothetical protein
MAKKIFYQAFMGYKKYFNANRGYKTPYNIIPLVNTLITPYNFLNKGVYKVCRQADEIRLLSTHFRCLLSGFLLLPASHQPCSSSLSNGQSDKNLAARRIILNPILRH